MFSQDKVTGFKKYFEKSNVTISASSLVKAEDFEGAPSANQIENGPDIKDKDIGTF